MKIRVVTADDHPLIHAGIVAVLGNDSRFEVVCTVTNAEGTLAACQEHVPDVLLLDLEMPGMPADDLLPQLPASVRVIVLTAHEGPMYVERIRKQKIHGYLLKSEVGLELIQAVAAVHHGAAWFTRKIALKMMGPDAEDPMRHLTSRECQILQLIAQGLGNSAISRRLHLAEQTVRNYVSTLYEKIGVSGRVEAVVWVRERGLLTPLV